MAEIVNFEEVRRDGKVINEGMLPERMVELGWQPEKVIMLRWKADGKLVELKFPNGVIGRVLDSRDVVIAKASVDKVLQVINSDGTERLRIPTIQKINGKQEPGEFCWFQHSFDGVPTHFGFVFELDSNHHQYRLDFDAETGKLLRVGEAR